MDKGLPYPQSYPGQASFAFIYFTLTASVYMAHFTLTSGSRVARGVRPHLLQDRVTPGDETTSSHVNTLTCLPKTTPWGLFNMIV